MKRFKISLKSLIDLLLILFLFVFLSYLIQLNLEFIESYFDIGYFGMLVFTIIVALSIILAPVSSVPLFPLATAIWGWKLAGFLGLVGWTFGAAVAFLIARKYGVRLVSRVLPIVKIHDFQKKMPREHLFLAVVFFRIVTPVDGVSYFVGLFTKMSFKSYILATIIGLIPFSFAVAYLGSVPVIYQIIFISIAFILFFIGILIAYYKKPKKKKRSS